MYPPATARAGEGWARGLGHEARPRHERGRVARVARGRARILAVLFTRDTEGNGMYTLTEHLTPQAYGFGHSITAQMAWLSQKSKTFPVQ